MTKTLKLVAGACNKGHATHGGIVGVGATTTKQIKALFSWLAEPLVTVEKTGVTVDEWKMMVALSELEPGAMVTAWTLAPEEM